MDCKTFSKIAIVCLSALFAVPIYAITVGITDINVSDSGLNVEQVSEYFQSEVQRIKSVEVRERNSIRIYMDHLSKCQSGIIDCGDTAKLPGLRKLDLIVFGKFHRHPEGYLLNVRAVSQKSWRVVYSGSLSGSDYEDLMENIADEMNDSLRVIAQKGKVDDPETSKYKYRIAVYQIKNANEAAQRVKVSHILDSIMVTAFSKRGRFQIVERSRIKDLLYEKTLAMSGLVQTNRRLFEARGITHYLNGSLKVYDEVRVLSYQIVNVKTGLPIVSDIIEWTDEKELKGAIEAVAEQSEERVFNTNGKLVIERCDVDNVIVYKESRETGSFPVEIGMCPLILEDIPKGKYSLLFKHDERDTLSMDIEIKPQETTRIKLVKMPHIDMGLFNEADRLEKSGRYKKAIEKYREFYKLYPRHRTGVYAMYREGFISQIYLREFIKGRKILEEVIKRKPDAMIRTEAFFGIALGYQASGNMGASRKILKMLINEYPGSTAAEVSRICLDRGKCPR